MKHLRMTAGSARALRRVLSMAAVVTSAGLAFGISTAKADGHGDVEAGNAKAAVCAACHGADGKGITPEWPNLAGQVPGYVAAQLQAFKSQARNNAVMYPQAQNLSDQDMKDLDAFYASLPAIVGAVSEDDAADALKGEKLYRGGVKDTQIPACMACHGPGAAGLKPLYPRLAGQKAAYIEKQLKDYKSGERKNNIMGPIAFKMSPEQMRRVALYLSGL